MNIRPIIEYTLAGFVVLILGALTGWYFFLHSQSQATTDNNAARGLTTQAPPASQPSVFARILEGIIGEKESSTPTTPQATQPSDVFSASSSTVATTSVAKRPARLWHVHTKPVAGMAFVKSGEDEKLRFVERATGYVYEAGVQTGVITRITNTLTPKTYEALITQRGRIIKRSLDDNGRITTSISVSIGTTGTSSSNTLATTTSALSSRLLPSDITRIVTDPRSDTLFYMVRTASGIEGFQSEWSGAKPKRVFASVITNWHPTWLSDGRIILAQAAADGMPGYAYELAANGTLRSLVRNILGLTILPHESGALIFGESAQGRLALFVKEKSTAAIRLPIKTVADKCAWATDLSAQSTTSRTSSNATNKKPIAYCGVPQVIATQSFLDEWYRGVVHSSDALWRVDTSGNAEIAYQPDASVALDILNPTSDNTGNYLAFINASDQSLWVVRIKE